MSARKLTATAKDGSIITRKTENDYTFVATNGYHATWHTRRDLAEKSASRHNYRGSGWYVVPVNETTESSVSFTHKSRPVPKTNQVEVWDEKIYCGIMIQGWSGVYKFDTGRIGISYEAAVRGRVVKRDTVEEVMSAIDHYLKENI